MSTTGLLKNRAFGTLWVGQALAAFGQSAFFLALYWVVQNETGSTVATGITGMVLALPALISPLAGVWVDRGNRVGIMFFADLIRLMVVLFLLAFAWMGGQWDWMILLAVGVSISLGAQFFGPAPWRVGCWLPCLALGVSFGWR